MAATTQRLSPAHEAQKLFFEIGMDHRGRVGASLVERRSAEGDRRVKALTLTPDGVALRDRVLEVMSEPPAAIAALSAADQRTLRDILRRAVEQLRV